MKEFAGTLTVRETSPGGGVADPAEEWPDGWMQHPGRVALLVHGFNNDEREATEAYAALRRNLPEGPAQVGCFHWPGDADFGWFRFADFLSYPDEIPDAREAARVLANHLVDLHRDCPAVELVLIGHSLGCRVILETLRRLVGRPAPPIAAIVLMAAAVPVELCEAGGPLCVAGSLADERIVLHSGSDSVLRFAFPMGQAAAFAIGHEPDAYLEPMGLDGDPVGFATAERDLARNAHGHYWGDPRVAEVIAAELGRAPARWLTFRTLPRHALPEPWELGRT
ncbi:MAG: alpha/beta hydrolase [Myxococcota bacterium]